MIEALTCGVEPLQPHPDVELHLVDRRLDRGDLQYVVDMPFAVVADADRPGFARPLERLHRLPLLLAQRLTADPPPRSREMHQHQIHVVELQKKRKEEGYINLHE